MFSPQHLFTRVSYIKIFAFSFIALVIGFGFAGFLMPKIIRMVMRMVSTGNGRGTERERVRKREGERVRGREWINFQSLIHIISYWIVFYMCFNSNFVSLLVQWRVKCMKKFRFHWIFECSCSIFQTEMKWWLVLNQFYTKLVHTISSEFRWFVKKNDSEQICNFSSTENLRINST